MSLEHPIELFGRFDAFASLSEEDLMVLASRSTIESMPPRTVLFRHGDRDRWMFCLLDGVISLEASDGRSHRLDAGGVSAGKLVSRLKPRRYTATAITPVSVIRIDSSGMGYWHSAVDPAGIEVDEFVDDAPDAADDPVELELPGIPVVAMEIQRLIDEDRCDVDTLAAVVHADPAVAARLIKAANSPVFYGADTIATVERAIVRLGTDTTRRLVTAFAMGELFRIEAPAFAELAVELWEHSTQVAAICFVLARRTGAFDPGEAQLAGLLHDVGVIPLLRAEARAPSAVDLDAAVTRIAAWRAPIGRALLEAWNFPQPLVDATVHADDWWRDPGPEPELADLVVVAQLLAAIGTRRVVDVPPVVRVPAFAKLLGPGFDADAAFALLEEADEQIRDASAMLRG